MHQRNFLTAGIGLRVPVRECQALAFALQHTAVGTCSQGTSRRHPSGRGLERAPQNHRRLATLPPHNYNLGETCGMQRVQGVQSSPTAAQSTRASSSWQAAARFMAGGSRHSPQTQEKENNSPRGIQTRLMTRGQMGNSVLSSASKGGKDEALGLLGQSQEWSGPIMVPIMGVCESDCLLWARCVVLQKPES